jgi:hypothetical protein
MRYTWNTDYGNPDATAPRTPPESAVVGRPRQGPAQARNRLWHDPETVRGFGSQWNAIAERERADRLRLEPRLWPSRMTVDELFAMLDARFPRTSDAAPKSGPTAPSAASSSASETDTECGRTLSSITTEPIATRATLGGAASSQCAI